jgi:hypothetical protein
MVVKSIISEHNYGSSDVEMLIENGFLYEEWFNENGASELKIMLKDHKGQQMERIDLLKSRFGIEDVCDDCDYLILYN